MDLSDLIEYLQDLRKKCIEDPFNVSDPVVMVAESGGQFRPLTRENVAVTLGLSKDGWEFRIY